MKVSWRDYSFLAPNCFGSTYLECVAVSLDSFIVTVPGTCAWVGLSAARAELERAALEPLDCVVPAQRAQRIDALSLTHRAAGKSSTVTGTSRRTRDSILRTVPKLSAYSRPRVQIAAKSWLYNIARPRPMGHVHGAQGVYPRTATLLDDNIADAAVANVLITAPYPSHPTCTQLARTACSGLCLPGTGKWGWGRGIEPIGPLRASHSAFFAAPTLRRSPYGPEPILAFYPVPPVRRAAEAGGVKSFSRPRRAGWGTGKSKPSPDRGLSRSKSDEGRGRLVAEMPRTLGGAVLLLHFFATFSVLRAFGTNGRG